MAQLAPDIAQQWIKHIRDTRRGRWHLTLSGTLQSQTGATAAIQDDTSQYALYDGTVNVTFSNSKVSATLSDFRGTGQTSGGASNSYEKGELDLRGQVSGGSVCLTMRLKTLSLANCSERQGLLLLCLPPYIWHKSDTVTVNRRILWKAQVRSMGNATDIFKVNRYHITTSG